MNEQHCFLLSDVLHCTNMNTDLIDCSNHLTVLNQCTTFRLPTYEINATIRICIQRILKVKIHFDQLRHITRFCAQSQCWECSILQPAVAGVGGSSCKCSNLRVGV